MSGRDITTGMSNALQHRVVRPVLIGRLDIATDPITGWLGPGVFAPTGTGDDALDGQSFDPMGPFVGMDDIQEDQGIGGPVTLSLAGHDLDEALLRQIVRDKRTWRGRDAWLWLGLLETGAALRFNGDQPAGGGETNPQYVEIPDVPEHRLTTQWTVEGWARKSVLNQTANGASLLEKANGPEAISVQFINQGVRVNAGGSFSVLASSVIAADEDVHVAVTYDNSGAAGELKLFLNGILDASTSGVAEADYTTPEPIWLGRREGHLKHTFKGVFDDVRLWNVARTQQQIYESMTRPVDPASTGLVGYWKLNEGTGTTAYDATSYGNDGTLNGGPAWVDALLPNQNGAVVADPVRIKTGVMTSMKVKRDKDQATVSVTIDQDLGNARSAPYRWVDHTRLFPADAFSVFIQRLANKPQGLDRGDVISQVGWTGISEAVQFQLHAARRWASF